MLETERLMMRPWEKADAANLYRYASDPDVRLIRQEKRVAENLCGYATVV